MINDHAKQRPFAMKREANETGKQKNGQRRPKCAKLSSGEPAMPVKDIFPLSLVTPAKISRWRRQIDTHLVGLVLGLVGTSFRRACMRARALRFQGRDVGAR